MLFEFVIFNKKNTNIILIIGKIIIYRKLKRVDEGIKYGRLETLLIDIIGHEDSQAWIIFF